MDTPYFLFNSAIASATVTLSERIPLTLTRHSLSNCIFSILKLDSILLTFLSIVIPVSFLLPTFLGKVSYIFVLYHEIVIINTQFSQLVSIYSIFVAKTSDANFSYVLSNLASVTKEMELGIADVHEELVKLNNSSAATVNAMQEVSIGTNDTAEAVQNQLLQTQSIQNKIDLVSESTSQISDNMQATLSVLQEGNRNVSILVEKVDTSVQSGEIVAEKLQALEQSVAEMNAIVDFINKIAKKTSLLSYNASIEAAHAGDFGKGFAVVASEIAEMATQTNDATTDITDLIKNTSEVITEVVSVIHNMIDDIKEEKHSTDSTADSFGVIRESTLSVRDNIELLSEHIHDLKEANTLIADSVQMVSAVSEEVSAHASETSAAEEENATILARIDERMQSLLDVIER